MTSPTQPSRPFSLCLVGAGKAGVAVAAALAGAGNTVVAVTSRSQGSAATAAQRLESRVAGIAVLPRCDVVLLGVPGGALRAVAEELAPRLHEGTVVWHLSGAHGLAPLAPATAAGALGAAVHPVQVFPDADRGLERLPGSVWGVTCDPTVRDWAGTVVTEDLRGHALDVEEEHRPVWHAAAVTTANGIAALLSLGEELLQSIAVGDPARVLEPLAAASVANAARSGAAASLTGPAARGEWDTVAAHLESLRSLAPTLVDPYLDATRVIFGGAVRAGRVSPEALRAAAAVLGEVG